MIQHFFLPAVAECRKVSLLILWAGHWVLPVGPPSPRSCTVTGENPVVSPVSPTPLRLNPLLTFCSFFNHHVHPHHSAPSGFGKIINKWINKYAAWFSLVALYSSHRLILAGTLVLGLFTFYQTMRLLGLVSKQGGSASPARIEALRCRACLSSVCLPRISNSMGSLFTKFGT